LNKANKTRETGKERMSTNIIKDPTLTFVSIGCNRIASCSHWGKNNLFAYAANQFVAIYDPIVCRCHAKQTHCIYNVK
jgi:hypothetical protein